MTWHTSRKFRGHVEKVTNKAVTVVIALSRISPNIGIIPADKKRLFYLIMESIILYGAPVWANAALADNASQRYLRAAQRIGLGKVVSGYRTVAYDALCILAGTIPIDLIIMERAILFNTVTEAGQTLEETTLNLLKKNVRVATMEKWQEKWDRAEFGRWTYRWSPNVTTWYSGKLGRPDFHTTQARTGHGCFRPFLKKINRGNMEECWFGCATAGGSPLMDDVEHTLFRCKRWSQERLKMKSAARTDVADTPEGWSRVVFTNKVTWKIFSDYCGDIIKKKEAFERRWKKAGKPEDPKKWKEIAEELRMEMGSTDGTENDNNTGGR